MFYIYTYTRGAKKHFNKCIYVKYMFDEQTCYIVVLIIGDFEVVSGAEKQEKYKSRKNGKPE